jgi:cell wall-associated NlpC family hydrolase
MSRILSAQSRARRQTSRLVAVLAVLGGVVLTTLTAAVPSAQASAHHHHRHAAHHHARHAHHAHHAGRAAGRVAHAMHVAVSEHGKPYAYGASGPHAFDCSGLTSYAFHHAGFGHMPRTAAAQAHFARHIARGRMHRGDLIFFTDGAGVYHVGMFAGFKHGHRLVLHAPYPGQRVRTQPLWTNRWFAGTLRFR